MAPSSGLGARFYLAGYDLSGDTQALDGVNGGNSPLDLTPISASAHVRLGGLRDGGLSWVSFFDKTGAHVPLSALPRTDEIGTFLVPPLTVGNVNSAACINGKQISYDPTRGTDGSLTLKTQVQASTYGLEWATPLTAGTRTDTGATNGTSWNQGAASLWGAQAYLQALALTGTDVTVTIQHSPDNTTWITLLAFTQIISGNLPPLTQRAATFGGPFTATNASPAVFTASGSALVNGTPVQLQTYNGSALPGGFTAGTTYYVVSASGSSFSLSATSGGSAINSTSAGSGWLYQVVQQYLRAITTTSGGFTNFQFVTAVNVNQVATVF